jgi:hypothetical protein
MSEGYGRSYGYKMKKEKASKLTEKQIRDEVMEKLWKQGVLEKGKGNLAVENAIFLTFTLIYKKLRGKT